MLPPYTTHHGALSLVSRAERLKNGKNICEFRKAIFPVFYNISPPNFGILLLLKGSSREFRFFVRIWLDQKLVYNANRPLLKLLTLN